MLLLMRQVVPVTTAPSNRAAREVVSPTTVRGELGAEIVQGTATGYRKGTLNEHTTSTG